MKMQGIEGPIGAQGPAGVPGVRVSYNVIYQCINTACLSYSVKPTKSCPFSNPDPSLARHLKKLYQVESFKLMND